MDNWEKIELSSIAEYSNSKIPLTEVPFENYISTENMKPDFGGIDLVSSLPKAEKVKEYKKGDVLFSNIRTYFKKLWMADRNGGCSGDVLVFRAKENIEPGFLFRTLMSEQFIDYSVKTSKGTKMPRGDKNALMQFEIKLPPLQEQKRIAHILGTLDDKIELNRKMNQTLESMAQALFQSWFVDFDPVLDNALAAGNPIPEPLKKKAEKRAQAEASKKLINTNPALAKLFPSTFVFNETLNKWIPEGWYVEKLSHFCECLDSQRKPISGQDREKIKGNIPYYGAMSIVDYINKYIYDGVYLLVSEDGANVVDENGRPATQYVWGKFWLNNHAHIIRGKSQYSTEFLKVALSFYNASHLVTGAAQPKINQKNLMSIELIAPSEKLLNLFDYQVKVYFEKIISSTEEISNLTQTRDTILPKLISGKIKV